jgi:hypothetical protein
MDTGDWAGILWPIALMITACVIVALVLAYYGRRDKASLDQSNRELTMRERELDAKLNTTAVELLERQNAATLSAGTMEARIELENAQLAAKTAAVQAQAEIDAAMLEGRLAAAREGMEAYRNALVESRYQQGLTDGAQPLDVADSPAVRVMQELRAMYSADTERLDGLTFGNWLDGRNIEVTGGNDLSIS